MVRSWLSRLLAVEPGDAPERGEETGRGKPLAPGERIYAVGDIHGRADLVDALWALIAEDLRLNPTPQASIVYLGDYVDRGPDSFGVIERLSSPPPHLPPAVALMGNHELVMMQFLDGADVGQAWRDFGGFETMLSYRVEPRALYGQRRYEKARADFVARMPAPHRAFLDNLGLSFDRPPFFFCHAGIRPGVPLARQTPDTLLWIREEFLMSDADFGRIVVHGHTPSEAPEIRRNRINVDTRAYSSGRLTCAALERNAVRIIATNS